MSGQAPPQSDYVAPTVVDYGLMRFWMLVQQYGFVILGVAVVALIAKGKFDEYQSRRNVEKLNHGVYQKIWSTCALARLILEHFVTSW